MTSRNHPLTVAWGGTVLAVVCGIWDGAASLLMQRELARYDAMTALTMLMVVGLIWYTYFTRETLELSRTARRDELDRRRRGTATGGLAELYNLVERLKNLNIDGPTAGTSAFISHPALDRAAESLDLFRVDTIQELTATLRQLEDIQESLAVHRERASTDGAANLGVTIRVRAAWAYNSAVRLVECLVAEGGAMPHGLTVEELTLPGRVELSPDPFER